MYMMMEAVSDSVSAAQQELFDWQKSAANETDFAIQLQGCIIACHKYILAKSSHYFNAMFLSSMKESLTDHVKLHETDKSPLLVLLKFAYTQKLDIDYENIFDVTTVAGMYQFQAASEICQEYLARKATTGNMWAEILVFSEVHTLLDARHAALRYILFYFSQELERKENMFSQLPKNHVKHILGHPRLNCQCELDVAKALDEWTCHDLNSRKADFAELFVAVVKLADLSMKDLHEILNLQSIQEDQTCQKLVRDEIVSLEKLSLENTDQSGHQSEERRTSRPGPYVLLSVGGDRCEGEITSPCLDIYQVDTESADMKSYASLHQVLPTCRINVGYRGCVLGKDLFITGGEAILGRNAWNMDVWTLDSFTKTWSCVTHLTQPRRHHGICVLDSSIILIGGMGRFRQILDSVEKYDTVKDEWTSLCPLMRSEYWPAVTVCQRQIYVIKNSIQRYDPTTDQWTTLSIELPFNLGFHSAMSLGNCIYMKCQYDGRLVKLRLHSDVKAESVTVGNFCACPDGQLIVQRDKIFVLGGSNPSDRMQQYDMVTQTFLTVGKPTHSIVGSSIVLFPDYSGTL